MRTVSRLAAIHRHWFARKNQNLVARHQGQRRLQARQRNRALTKASCRPGAYLLEAKGAGKSSRDLILVTDASLVLKTSGKQALVYVCNALDSSPLADGKVRLWERYYQENHWHWRDASKKTDPDGIAVFDLVETANSESKSSRAPSSRIGRHSASATLITTVATAE